MSFRRRLLTGTVLAPVTLVTLAALFTLTAPAAPTPARAAEPPALRLPLRLPAPDAAASALDLACRLAVGSGDTLAIRKLNTRLLTDHADEGWPLVALGRNLVALHGPAAARQLVADRATLPPALRGLSDPALAVIQGVTSHAAHRYASAAAAFRRALVDRPAWTACHAYLFICGGPLQFPRPARQAELDLCDGDALALELILQNVCFALSDERDDTVFTDAVKLMQAGPRSQSMDALVAALQLETDLLAANGDPALAEATWLAYCSATGEPAWLHDDVASYAIIRTLPARECLALLDKYGADPRGSSFRERAIELQILLRRVREASRRLDLETGAADRLWNHRLEVLYRTADAATILAAMRAAHADDLIPYRTLRYQSTLETIGATDLWAAVWTELDRENPTGAIRHRIDAMPAERDGEKAALLDSLRGLDLFPDPFVDERRRFEFGRGGGPALAEILTQPDAVQRRDDLRLASMRARIAGNDEEAGQVLAARVVAEGRAAFALFDLMIEAIERSDRATAEAAKTALSGALPGDPLAVLAELRFRARFEGQPAARALLDAVEPAAWLEPDQLTELAHVAAYLEHHELADEASLRALALAPRGIQPLYTRAELLAGRMEPAAADSLYRILAAEYPGSQYLAQKLLTTGTSVTSLTAAPGTSRDLEQAFAPFGYDLDDVDAIRNLAVSGAAIDSLQSDVYILQSRRSTLLQDLENACDRHRLTVQILSEAGAEMYRTHIIPFSPDDGVPYLRVVRVIPPSGEVLEVPRDEIMIRAPTDDEGDVTDSREMVIPLPGVAPGAIIDIVHDVCSREHLAGGWANIIGLSSSFAARELSYEIKAAPGMPMRIVLANGVETLPTGDDPTIRAWRVTNVRPAREEEDWTPAYVDRTPWIGMTTFADWAAVGRAYGDSFWNLVEPGDEVRALAGELCKGLKSRSDKAAALYRHVAEEIDPVAVELGAGRIIPTPPSQVLKRGWGDCKDTSTLLLSLLAAVGIEARPVLVSTWQSMTPREDLPTIASFNHMIVQITGIEGAPYCDPLNGSACLAPLPAASAGRLALHLGRDRDAELRPVPETAAAENGYVMTADVTPVGESELRYDITCRYRGEAAAYMRGITSFADTNQTRRAIDLSVGYGVAEGVPLRSWKIRKLDCGEIEVQASYVDSSWAPDGATSADVRFTTEAPVYWELPRSADRRADVVFRSPYEATTVLRLHGTENWVPSDRMAEFASKDDLHEGSMTVKSRNGDAGKVVEVDLKFRLAARTVPVARYAEFRRSALAHYMYGAQIYRYHQVIDEKLLEKSLAYTREFPDDHGFRVKAALELVGTTLGGRDEHGRRRRDIARQLLAPVLAEQNAPQIAMIAAGLEAMDGRYARTDSLLDAALAASPRDMQLVASSANAKRELLDFDGEIARLQDLVNLTGNADVIGALLGTLIAADRREEAERQWRRLEMMDAMPDSLGIHLLRYGGHVRAHRLPEMAREFEALEGLLPAERQEAFRVSHHMSLGRWEDARVLLEEMLAANPTESWQCNNLAWCLAMLDRDLERAEMLARAASVLSDDPVSAANTLGFVYARQGRWKEARDLFRGLFEGDDRPSHRLANGYFLGLCALELGDTAGGLAIWDQSGALAGDPIWHKGIAEGRRVLAAGGRAADTAFTPAGITAP